MVLLRRYARLGIALGGLALAAGMALAAQDPEPGGPGARGGPGFAGRFARPGGPGGPGGEMGLVRQPTAADLPVEVLESALKLTPDQQDRVRGIHRSLRETARAAMPAPRPNSERPDRAAMESARAKMDAARAAATAKITALLTESQKASLATLVKDAGDFDAVHFPPDATTALKLTEAQRSKIGAIAADASAKAKAVLGKPRGAGFDPQGLRTIGRNAHQQAVAVLTDTQKKAFAELRERRWRDAGGPGGRGFGRPGPRMPGGRGGYGMPGPGNGAGGPGMGPGGAPGQMPGEAGPPRGGSEIGAPDRLDPGDGRDGPADMRGPDGPAGPPPDAAGEPGPPFAP